MEKAIFSPFRSGNKTTKEQLNSNHTLVCGDGDVVYSDLYLIPNLNNDNDKIMGQAGEIVHTIHCNTTTYQRVRE
jgi:hypothetical protein